MFFQPKIDSWGQWKVAWLSPSNVSKVSTLITNSSIDGVGIDQHNEKGANLKLLNRIPAPNGLILADVEEFDLSEMPIFPSLRFLVLGETRNKPLDFRQFNALQELRIVWHPRDNLVDRYEHLHSLSMSAYRPKVKNLGDIKLYDQLQTLELVQSNIENVFGIEDLISLKELQLHYCNKLSSIEGLAETNAEHIHIDSCKNIESFEVLSKCRKLRTLRIGSNGTIPSLKFINECEFLEELTFVNTTIADNDLSPLLRLKYAGFTNKRSYSHTFEQVQSLISNKEKCGRASDTSL